jgi:Ca-activated chloride channel family protein
MTNYEMRCTGTSSENRFSSVPASFSTLLRRRARGRFSEDLTKSLRRFGQRRHLFADSWLLCRSVLCILIFAFTTGQIWRDKVSRKNAEGNALYEQRNFPAALDKYVEANDGKAHRQELAYNLANTFYQQKKYPDALRELEKAIASGDSPLNEKIYFNRGNTFFQMGKYQEAIESYKKALEITPSDKEAKHNLELALKKLQENPQEQQKDSKKKDQQSKQDKQDQKREGSSDQQKQQPPSQPKDQQSQPQNLNKSEAEKKQRQPGQQQKPGMDPKEALRILDALNQQEKQEQRKQALKIQRERVGGKDW